MNRERLVAKDGRGDHGMAMLAAVVCMFIIVGITALAVQQSVGSLSGFAQGRKLLQTVDAAESGVQKEISTIQGWLTSPNGTIPCPGGNSVTGLPSGQGWVSAGTGSADQVANAASLGYYTLSVATSATPPLGPPAALPASAACYGNNIPAPTGTSAWYVIVQAKGVTSATTGGTTATGRTLQALLLVHNYSTSAYHRRSQPGRTVARVVLIGLYTTGTTTYTSNGSAQAISFTPLVTSPSAAAYTGSGPPDPNVVSSSQPATSIFGGESWLTAGALAQYAEADSSGASKSCAGLVASPGSIQVGSANPTCTTSGSPGATGVKLDLSTLPGVGSVLSTLADVTLETSTMTSSASMGTGGSPTTGAASLGTLYVKVTVVLGVTVTIPVTIISGPNQDLLSEVTTAMTGDSAVIGLVTSTLVSTLKSTLALTSNYQTTNAGVFSVSAIRVTILSGGVTADIAKSTVGPNSVTVPSTTTTTTPSTTTTTTLPTTTTTLPPNTVTVVWIRQVP